MSRPRQRISVIESDEYRREVEQLKADPLIQAMEASLQPDVDTEEWAFIRAASDEYQRRGGEAMTIGGPARAITALRASRPTATTTEEVNTMSEPTTTSEEAEVTEPVTKPKQDWTPLTRKRKLTRNAKAAGAEVAKARGSRYTHVLDANGMTLCGLNSASWKKRAELTPAQQVINCPVCAEAQKAL